MSSRGQPTEIALVQLFELPSPMAHAIQILQTGDALARSGVPTHLFARTAGDRDPRALAAEALGRAPDDRLTLHRVQTRHKGLAGLRYRARLVRLLARGDVAFHGRQRRQTIFVLDMRRIVGRGARVAYEFHNLEHAVARSGLEWRPRIRPSRWLRENAPPTLGREAASD